jgi:protein-disulfide isomerase
MSLGIAGTPTFLINGRKVDATDWAGLEPLLKAGG